jgi:hypothetical protein
MFTIRLTIGTAGALIAVAALAGCSQNNPPAAGSGNSADRVAALHTAAECLRQHGITNFTDPVLGANGQVFTDRRPLDDAEGRQRGAADAAQNACRSQLGAANWNPGQQPPAPPELVAAGVKAAQCLRQHGLTTYHDPTANTPYTPGHGFGIQPQDLPPGSDKGTPTVQTALDSCRSLLDAEIDASRLDHLAGK